MRAPVNAWGASPDLPIALEDLPGPRPWPVVGNSLSIDAKAYHLQMERWAEVYGPRYLLRLGTTRTLVLSDPEAFQQVLRQRPETFRRSEYLMSILEELNGPGLFTSEGDSWRAQRRVAMSALSARHLRSYYPILATSARRLLSLWRRAAASGEAREIRDDFTRFTLDVIAHLALGIDVNAVEDPDGSVAQDMHTAFQGVALRMFLPVPYWRFVKLPYDRRLDAAVGRLGALAGESVARARKALRDDPARADAPRNFVEGLLAESAREGSALSDAAILGNAFQLIGAGTDTTANTLSWMAHLYCDDAPTKARMQAEADAALGDADYMTSPAVGEQLPFTQAVADEAMRLRPTAPLLGMAALRDTVVSGVRVPAGTDVFGLFRPRGMLDGNRFEAPERFLPARFMGSMNEAQRRAHIPFGDGARICAGRSLALVEIKVATSLLMRHFDVERVGEAQAVREVSDLTMRPDGLRLRLRERR